MTKSEKNIEFGLHKGRDIGEPIHGLKQKGKDGEIEEDKDDLRHHADYYPDNLLESVKIANEATEKAFKQHQKFIEKGRGVGHKKSLEEAGLGDDEAPASQVQRGVLHSRPSEETKSSKADKDDDKESHHRGSRSKD